MNTSIHKHNRSGLIDCTPGRDCDGLDGAILMRTTDLRDAHQPIVRHRQLVQILVDLVQRPEVLFR